MDPQSTEKEIESAEETASRQSKDEDAKKIVSSKSATMDLWSRAQSKAVPSVKLSQSFRTLRDMITDAEIDLSSLTQERKLGEGAFATVYKCIYRKDGAERPVAVKRLKPDVFASDLDLEDFVREALLLKKLSHRNIVGLIGVGSDMARISTLPRTQKKLSADRVFVVTEYMNQGTLFQKVVSQMKSAKTVYTYDQGLDWLIQIAKGVKYLHNANPRVIHRDLKIENVLLTQEGDHIVAKIGDFGLHALVPAKKQTQVVAPSTKEIVRQTSKIFTDQARSFTINKRKNKPVATEDVFRLSGKTGSLMYMAPEVLKCKQYNEKADVFSFSIIAYEVLQKCILLAFVSLKGHPSEVDQYIESVVSGFRPILPKYWPDELKRLLQRCWADAISDRPTMDEIVTTLSSIRQQNLLNEDMAEPSRNCSCCIQ